MFENEQFHLKKYRWSSYIFGALHLEKNNIKICYSKLFHFNLKHFFVSSIISEKLTELMGPYMLIFIVPNDSFCTEHFFFFITHKCYIRYMCYYKQDCTKNLESRIMIFINWQCYFNKSTILLSYYYLCLYKNIRSL